MLFPRGKRKKKTIKRINITRSANESYSLNVFNERQKS